MNWIIKSEPHQTVHEEISNAVTAGIGVVFGIIALIILTKISVGQNNHYKIIASVLFGASLIAMYLSSALYHIVQQPYYKYILKILDHATIYLLIAGSYTPFALVSLRGPIGWHYLL